MMNRQEGGRLQVVRPGEGNVRESGAARRGAAAAVLGAVQAVCCELNEDGKTAATAWLRQAARRAVREHGMAMNDR